MRAARDQISRNLVSRSRKPPILTLREFAEAKIVIPEGPFEGSPFRVYRQPFSGLFFDEVDSGNWRRFAVTGCVQSGKTLQAVVIPLLWHLFEHCESVIMGVPNMEMAGDKWRMEVLPAINAVPEFRDLLPVTGKGSKGGDFDAITFLHGPSLKFMTGRGGDETRSGVTARVVVITEVDKMDVAKASSREADPVTQLENRARAYSEDTRLYMECTTSIPRGRIHVERLAGTASRITTQCPHCLRAVSPEREDFKGFKEAENEIDAGKSAHFSCRNCGKPFSDAQRRQMNEAAFCVHRGQKVNYRKGRLRVSGPLPKTRTMGFRWNAWHNQFWTSEYLGEDQWRVAADEDEDNAEKNSTQMTWALPWDIPGLDETRLDTNEVKRRTWGDRRKWTRSYVPDSTVWLTLGVDMGKRLAHWVLTAWLGDGTAHVVDYGRFEVPSDDLGVEAAISLSLKDFCDEISSLYDIQQAWIDARWQSDQRDGGKPIYDFISGLPATEQEIWRPALGYGWKYQKHRNYTAPKNLNDTCVHLGDNFHFDWVPARGIFLVKINADAWKLNLHRRYLIEAGATGSISLFASMDKSEHQTFAKHITAEHHVIEFVPERGEVDRFVVDRRQNHFLDASYLANCAAEYCGFGELVSELKLAV